MRALLKNKTRRQLEIVEYLLESDGWTTVADLAEIFDYSTRNIKSDISELKEKFSELQFETGYLGIRLKKDSETGIQSIYRKILNETLFYKILEKIFFDETLTIDELSEKFFVSSSTVYRSITQIHEHFEKHYQCYIETNPCRLVGNEQNIRLFYRTYFSEKYTILGWPFKTIDEKKVDSIFDKVLSFVATDMSIDFAYYETIKLVVIVNKIRYDHGHLVERYEEETELLNLFVQIYKYTLAPLGILSTVAVNKES